MTFEIACMVCGAAIYSGFDLKSPNDVMKTFGYKCRKCGARLNVDKFRVEIKKLDGSFS